MNSLLNNNDYVAIVANSNGIDVNNKEKIDNLIKLLKNIDLNPIISPVLYKKNGPSNGTGEERAHILNTYFKDEKVKAIFDISGGDLSNETLNFIDFEAIANNPKPFFGYSDLSTILNAINHKSNIKTYHYQIRHLVGNYSENQKDYFINSFMKNSSTEFSYKFIRGDKMEGTVLGGNIRCLLKLMGTKFQPDFNNKILFIESLSGDSAKIATFLNQYQQIGAFENLKGIILGTFTEMENKNCIPTVEDLLIPLIDSSIPIIKSYDLGHGEDCKCIIIGETYSFKQ